MPTHSLPKELEVMDEMASSAIGPQSLVQISADSYKQVFQGHAGGVTVITASAGEARAGLTATSLVSISLSPPLVSFAIDSASSSWPVFRAAESLTVNFLGEAHAWMAKRFATSGIDRFAEPVTYEVTPEGYLILTGARSILACQVVQRIPVGDHMIMVAEVKQFAHEQGVEPLIYCDREFGSFLAQRSELRAGLPIRYSSGSGAVIHHAELADALGYLSPLRLEHIGESQSGPESLRLLAIGLADCAGAFNGSLRRFADSDQVFTPVCPYYGSGVDNDNGLYVLAEGPVRRVEDLVSARIGVNDRDGHAAAMIEKYLESSLDAQDGSQPELVVLRHRQLEPALRAGEIDAAYLFGSYQAAATKRNGLRRIANDASTLTKISIGSYVLSNDFVERNPKEAAHFVDGLKKAVLYADTHGSEQVRKILRNYLSTRDRAGDAKQLEHWRGNGYTRGGELHPPDFELWTHWGVGEEPAV